MLEGHQFTWKKRSWEIRGSGKEGVSGKERWKDKVGIEVMPHLCERFMFNREPTEIEAIGGTCFNAANSYAFGWRLSEKKSLD